MSRSEYLDGLRLFLRTLPAILDHLTDIPVLLMLWSRGYFKLFWLGLLIDLLPGPLAVYQFYLLGHRKGCLALILHPLNVFLFTTLSLLKIKTDFSRKVVAFSHEAQALLESPMQVI